MSISFALFFFSLMTYPELGKLDGMGVEKHRKRREGWMDGWAKRGMKMR